MRGGGRYLRRLISSRPSRAGRRGLSASSLRDSAVEHADSPGGTASDCQRAGRHAQPRPACSSQRHWRRRAKRGVLLIKYVARSGPAWARPCCGATLPPRRPAHANGCGTPRYRSDSSVVAPCSQQSPPPHPRPARVRARLGDRPPPLTQRRAAVRAAYPALDGRPPGRRPYPPRYAGTECPPERSGVTKH